MYQDVHVIVHTLCTTCYSFLIYYHLHYGHGALPGTEDPEKHIAPGVEMLCIGGAFPLSPDSVQCAAETQPAECSKVVHHVFVWPFL